MPRAATLAVVLSVVALLTLVAAACGGAGDEEPPAPATRPAATEQPTVQENATETAPTEPPATAEPAATDTPAPPAAATPAEPEEPEEPDASADGDERLQIVTLLPPDAIPAINNPSYITAGEADGQLRLTDLIIGVSINGEHRAYGAAYLSAHEIVNDTLGGRAIAVTW